MKSLKNKIIEIKKLLNEKNFTIIEPIVVTSNTPDNLTPRMKTKINKIETQSSIKIKPITSADDINLDKYKQDSLNLKKNATSLKNIEDVLINPSSYLLRDGSINFSKLLIDEVLAADKLLIEAAKLTYDIAGNFCFIYTHSIESLKKSVIVKK